MPAFLLVSSLKIAIHLKLLAASLNVGTLVIHDGNGRVILLHPVAFDCWIGRCSFGPVDLLVWKTSAKRSWLTGSWRFSLSRVESSDEGIIRNSRYRISLPFLQFVVSVTGITTFWVFILQSASAHLLGFHIASLQRTSVYKLYTLHEFCTISVLGPVVSDTALVSFIRSFFEFWCHFRVLSSLWLFDFPLNSYKVKGAMLLKEHRRDAYVRLWSHEATSWMCHQVSDMWPLWCQTYGQLPSQTSLLLVARCGSHGCT